MEVWPFIPQSRIEESLEWLTSIRRCRAAEQRDALRYTPRQEFIFNYVMNASQFSRSLAIAKAISAPSVYLPIWPDWVNCPTLSAGATTITVDTSLTDITAGSNIIVWNSDSAYEVHEVESNVAGAITLASAIVSTRVNAILMPLREADFIQEYEAERGAHSTIKSTARFRLIDVPYLGEITNFAYPTYRTLPVVTSRSIVKNTLNELFTREYEEIDPGVGPVTRLPIITSPKQDSAITWSTLNRADRRKLYGWLHSRRGQWKAFYSPTWNNDFSLMANIGAADTTITVQDTNARATMRVPFDIALEMSSGAFHFARVIAVAAGTIGLEVLTLSTTIGSAITSASVTTFSRLVKYRFASDRVDVYHGLDGAAKASAPIVEVPL